MIEPNIIALMSNSEMDTMIPESLKEMAWQRYKDSEGKLAYSQRTWRDMTEDINYIAWYGNTDYFTKAIFNGKIIGDVSLVKGRVDLMVDNFEALGNLGFKYISQNELNKFYSDNK